MRRATRRGHTAVHPSLAALAAGLALSLAGGAWAEEIAGSQPAFGQTTITEAVAVGMFDGDLRDLAPVEDRQPGDPVVVHSLPGERRGEELVPAADSRTRPVFEDRDTEYLKATAVGTERDIDDTRFNFEGMSYTESLPPDPTGDVGGGFYIQAVNHPSGARFQVYSSATGEALTGPTPMDAIPGETECFQYGHGSPTVLYDEQADRWLLGEVGLRNSNYYMCMYVSRGPDPVSDGWYSYAFEQTYSGGPSEPLYPHFAVWPNYERPEDWRLTSYFATSCADRGDGTCLPAVYAFERGVMLTGDKARELRSIQEVLPGYGFQALTFADHDGGKLPPEGAPGVLMRHWDVEAHASASPERADDALQIWQVKADWENETLDVYNLNQLSISPFNSWMDCEGKFGYLARTAIPQYGETQCLEGMREIVMNRLQYREMDGNESLVGSFVTNLADTDNDPEAVNAAVRWFELQGSSENNVWAVAREGDWGESTGDARDSSRWMGSIAQDRVGRLALGYNLSWPTGEYYPSLFYADPTNTKALAEYILAKGESSQATYSAWGGHTSMTVDPVDGCTFWFTGPCTDAGKASGWLTQIAAFSFTNPANVNVLPNNPAPVCPGTSVTLTANPSPSGSYSYQWYKDGAPIAGATGSSYNVTGSSYGTSSYNCEVTGSGCGAGVMDQNPVNVTFGIPPSFGGARWVLSTSGDGCGYIIGWNPATACPGYSVVYNVHRSGSSSFTPSASNRIASCVTSLSYVDLTVPEPGMNGDKQDYYYVVRAEDSSVDSTGPCNGGLEDTNTVIRGPWGWLDTVTYSAGTTGMGQAQAAGWRYDSAPHGYDWTVDDEQFLAQGDAAVTRKYLATPWLRLGGTATLRFDMSYGLPPGENGVVLEICTNPAGGCNSFNPGDWTDLGSQIIGPSGAGYDNMLTGDNPLAGRMAWSADQQTFYDVTVDLSPWEGEFTRVRWLMGCSSSSGTGGYRLDNIRLTNLVDLNCTTGAAPDPVLTSTGRMYTINGNPKNHTVTLEWVNPQNAYTSVHIIYRNDRFPTHPTDGTEIYASYGSGPGNYDSYTHTNLSLGLTYYYTTFVYHFNDQLDYWSQGKSVKAQIYDTTLATTPNWIAHYDATALTPPAIGSFFALSNNRFVYSTTGGTSGGVWPIDWTPSILNGPAQSRPPVVPGAIPGSGASKVLFTADQAGWIYAINGDDGATPIWSVSGAGSIPFGMFQAAPAGVFQMFSGGPLTFDMLLIGTRNSGEDNRFLALNPDSGVLEWSFDNGGGPNGIGIINATASAVYPDAATPSPRVYFSSRRSTSFSGGSSGTLWCLNFDEGSAFLCPSSAAGTWPLELGDIDVSPVPRGNTIYVGNTAGVVFAVDVDPANGAVISIRSRDTADGGLNGFIWPHPFSSQLYVSTKTRVWKLDDDGAQLTPMWTLTLDGPSTPALLPGTNYLYVGTADGKVVEVDVTTGSPATPPTYQQLVIGDGLSTVGSPAIDLINDPDQPMAAVGSEAGAVYAFDVPLPIAGGP